MNRQPIKVLLIEDNEADAHLVRALLARTRQVGWDLPPFDLAWVDRLAAGMDRLDQDEFDVLLTDLDLPDSPALETFTRLRSHAPHMPIVVLTGHEDPELARRTVRAGAQDYLFKRVLSSSLLAYALLHAIERQQIHEELERRVAERTAELARSNAALRESEARHRLFLEHYQGIAYQAELSSYRPSLFLGAVKQITGYEAKDFLTGKMRWDQIIHPDDLPLLQRENGRLRTTPGYQATNRYRIRRRDGEIRWVVDSARVVSGPEGKKFTQGSVHDVTERQQAEEQLRETNRRLKLALDFADVALWEHDLREPLRAVRGFLQLLREEIADQADAKSIELIQIAQDEAQRMQEMLQGLRDLSRISIEEQTLVPTDCQAVLEQVLQALQFAIEESETQITAAPLPTVLADRSQLGQVFQNLIDNAIKFRSEEPPRIEIWAEQRNDRWVLAVQDNGIGIDPTQSERIFEPFGRLHTREEYEGTGIGLTLCRRIIEHHGGRIWVESQPGAGATFYFTLSACDDEQKPAER